MPIGVDKRGAVGFLKRIDQPFPFSRAFRIATASFDTGRDRFRAETLLQSMARSLQKYRSEVVNAMSLFNIRKTLVGLAIGLIVMIAGSSEANAQSRRQIERERQRIEREQRRANGQRQGGYDRIMTRANNAHFDQGYQQGIMAGQYDRRKNKYNQSNVYRGTGSAPNEGDPTSTDYIYRQGYLQGYHDGYNGGIRY
jgi:hypothetical protein